MPRGATTARAATAEDLPSLVTLAGELQRAAGRIERAVNPSATPDVEERIRAVLDDPASHIAIAEVDGQVAGMTVMRIVQPDPLSDHVLLQVSHIIVGRGHRHRGIGRCLIEAATEFATSRHLDYVAVSVYPSARDASRFFARLGFAPAVLYRIASVGALRRRFGVEHVAALGDGAARRRYRLRRPPARAQRALDTLPRVHD